ncbi:hypothetical protein PFICI_12074 [Pestalotiopsis fici W106-1]|uniref:Protein kinase domain-containing protein n=1 Tax=Pestalotiopsis fici (strain W106-1 / CGMCC3.15140) TaxID=1229662 RepID=W3WU66_PESFW|nr:uncharacterized protein PFICI_12074 [Pestalotiopsis fici W106-1]ETS76687.1 hypothetical protein PFICI_12074 [Pestalotiopsis fici W106-1]
MAAAGYDRIDVPNYKRYVRWSTQAFRNFRRAHDNPNADLSSEDWRDIQVPAPALPKLFVASDEPTTHWYQDHANNEGLSRILGRQLPDDDVNHRYQRRLRSITGYFNRHGQGTWTPVKILAKGGQGMAIHFRHDLDGNARNVVMKIDLRDWFSKSLQDEKRATLRQRRAAHSVQIIPPRLAGGLQIGGNLYTRDPNVSDDSSDDELSDYDGEGAGDPRPRELRMPRGQRLPGYWDRSKADHDRRADAFINAGGRRRNREDVESQLEFMLLEYMENGSLSSLIKKRSTHDQADRPPNRVLWAFWLCLVRGCIGMDYPPSKFHPNRRPPPGRPEGDPAAREEHRRQGIMRRSRRLEGSLPADPGSVHGERAGIMHMMQDVNRLGLPLWWQQQYDQAMESFRRYADDLNEELPAEDDLLRRRENVVHFDLDPNNVLIGGFEMSAQQIQDWGAHISRTRGPGGTMPSNKEPHPGRIQNEHVFVPRLKIADFGIADRVKTYKRNIYYWSRRHSGKRLFLAPEQFGREWDMASDLPNDADIGEAQIPGSFSRKTNIWQIAWCLWCFITMQKPPMPPQPQIPPNYRHLINDDTPVDQYDQILESAGYRGPISYCYKLCENVRQPDDPFGWVDLDLRQTLYRCMYHNPDHRPDFAELISQAMGKVGGGIPGEDDGVVRAWVEKWFYNAPAPPPPPPPPPPPNEFVESLTHYQSSNHGGGGMELDGAAFVFGGSHGGGYFNNAAGLPPLTPAQQAFLDRFRTDYPHGAQKIHNVAGEQQCGRKYNPFQVMAQEADNYTVQAVADSIRVQIPSAMLPAGAFRPTMSDLQAIYRQLYATGVFNAAIAAGVEVPDRFYTADTLAAILERWGDSHGVLLQLVVMLPTGAPYLVPTANAAGRPVYIYSNWSGSGMPMAQCHYEGLHPIEAANLLSLSPGEV